MGVVRKHDLTWMCKKVSDNEQPRGALGLLISDSKWERVRYEAKWDFTPKIHGAEVEDFQLEACRVTLGRNSKSRSLRFVEAFLNALKVL